MSLTTPITKRPNLAESLMESISEMIFDGRLAAGTRINEVHLAQALGVSRTPLREALSGLVSEGALQSLPRHGFYVRTLSANEAKAIYPIRSYLDTEALRLSGIPNPSALKRLEEHRLALEEANDPYEAIRLDDAWHEELWSTCPNPVLIDIIRQFMRRTRRYELASMSDRFILKTSAESKREIESRLGAGNLTAACEQLRKSLQDGLIPVLKWLEERDAIKHPGNHHEDNA